MQSISTLEYDIPRSPRHQIIKKIKKHALAAGPFTPLEIQRAGRHSKHNSAKLQVLLEQWAAADGIWTQSDFYLQIKQKKRTGSMAAESG